MEVRNCRTCGNLFNFIGGKEEAQRLCPSCIDKLEDKFQEVKEFIEENKTVPMDVVVAECDISRKQLEKWIREERLMISEDSPLRVNCEKCGTKIRFGKVCENCKKELEVGFFGLPTMEQKKKKDSKSRMRFLDNK